MRDFRIQGEKEDKLTIFGVYAGLYTHLSEFSFPCYISDIFYERERILKLDVSGA